jgi:hypothetical protein
VFLIAEGGVSTQFIENIVNLVDVRLGLQ